MLAAGFVSAGVAAAADGLTLARDGESDYVIVIPGEVTLVEQTAARELSDHLAEVTGARLPVVSDAAAPVGAPRVVLGHGALTKELLPDLDVRKLGPDAIVIKTVGRDLVLVGHQRRGTLYAVYTFLEDTVGIRWWTMSETTIPRCPTLSIPRLDVTYAPKVSDRATPYIRLGD